MKMPAMQAVVDVLESEGVEVVFGIPGAAILPLYDALEPSPIRHITVRHEAGGCFAADGYARTTGKVGVNLGTSGPAGTNMITGLYTAQADSIPLVCVTGQAAVPNLHKEAFQALDIVSVAKPVTKWAVQLKEPAQAPWMFREAFRVARSGRPGAVLIDLPLDVTTQEIDYEPRVSRPLPVAAPEPAPEPIRAALEMLLDAERPLIMSGGGVILGEAGDELRALAEYLQIPVTITLMGKGSFPEDHPLFASMAGLQTQTRWGNQIFLESDVVLAVGARFAERHMGDPEVYRGDRRFIHIDIEPMQLGRVFEPDLGIVAHARPALQALREQASEMTPAREPGEWVARVDHLRSTLTRRDDFDDVPIKPPRVYREMNEFFGRDTTFVTAIGLYQIWSGQFQRSFLPRRYLCCGQAGPLGWDVSAAMGAKIAHPERLVVAVVGDYSFQFLMEQLAVAAQYQVPIVIVMINNVNLALIRQAETNYDMRYGVDLDYSNPNAPDEADDAGVDHCKIMEAFGCAARRVVEPDDIRPALAWAVEQADRSSRPALVEVMIERDALAAIGTSIDAIKEFEPPPQEAEAQEPEDVPAKAVG
ncbi:glyoxylate carboligase [soil metagenome]